MVIDWSWFTRSDTTITAFVFYPIWQETSHSYTYRVTKSPTTTAAGTLTGTCGYCGGTTTVTLPKLTTTDYTYTVTTKAGCLTTGTGKYTWKTTTYGSFSFNVTIPATGHTVVTDSAVAATCTATGRTAGSHCSVCGTVITAQTTVPAKGHSYTYKSTKAPTTTSTGTLTGTCGTCSGTTTVTLPKLTTTDYTYTITTKAGCLTTGTGKYTWKTTTYGSFSFNVTIPATGHTAVTDPAVAATCTTTGLTAGSHCSVCGTVLTAQTTVPAGSHSYTYRVTKNPTTTATGTLTGTCAGCSGTTTVTLPKLTTTDYTYTITTKAGCLTKGTGKYTWKTTTYGRFSFNVTIPATGHTAVTDPAVAATCTTTGLTEGSHCSVCGTVITAQTTVPAGSHSYTYRVTKNPTTTATGTLTGTCAGCSGTVTVTLPKLNITNYTYTVTTQAGCLTPGRGKYTWKTTTYGSFSFNVTIPATGHTEVTDEAVAATCSATGLTEGSHCETCGTVLTAQTELPITDHNYVFDGGVRTATANRNGLIGPLQCSYCADRILGRQTVSKTEILALPAMLKQLDAYAFKGISSQQINLPEGCTTIRARAFSDCRDLKLVVIPDSLTSLAADAFYNCGDIVFVCTSSCRVLDALSSIGYVYVAG